MSGAEVGHQSLHMNTSEMGMILFQKQADDVPVSPFRRNKSVGLRLPALVLIPLLVSLFSFLSSEF